MLKFVILWDVFWRNWRRLVKKYIGELKEKYSPDFMIANSENMTSWRWPVLKHIQEMQEMWFDCLTWWNHTFANLKDIKEYIDSPEWIQLRPANYYNHPDYRVPWKWFMTIEKNWKKVLVINLMSSVFIGWQLYNPFMKADEILKETWLDFDAIILDFHRETTAESYVMSEYLDWRISLMYWTHTHVQTNDEHILQKWTWMITDVWMVWPLHSSIWQKFEDRMPQFLTWINIFNARPEQDLWQWVVNWIYVEIEDKKCIKIEKIRIIEQE
ncbi:MAG: hypothetical protein ACD_3C00054G0014 [uncultured bacterium (gcode 4)]|uniref:Metallophosphoesterase n=1 Tax=uncultured bacterium (gcode 4) TaxID=1234023 RepID=K2GDY2_9BACT|nr:MAG: hypothetical protein ACD_3C00054G0014 [uncultured bacterium (gcode 4)]